MKAETEAVWSERVEAWRRSGQRVAEFAADKRDAAPQGEMVLVVGGTRIAV